MGFFDKPKPSRGGGSTENCPWCGAALIGAKDGGWVEGRYECPTCEGGVFFKEDGKLVDSMHRGSGDRSDSCDWCESSLSGGISYLPYEDGSNSDAYIICPSCRQKNYR